MIAHELIAAAVAQPDATSSVVSAAERLPLLGYPAVIDVFARGGVVMIPILLLSVLGVFFWLRGALAVRALRRELPRSRTLLRMAEQRNFTSLRDAARAGLSLTDRVAERLLVFRADPVSELRRQTQELLTTALRSALSAHRWVGICAKLAPILGLLGTVVGISMTFNLIAATGGTGNYEQLADGIHQALYTTIFGLIVALVLTVLGALLHSRMVALEHETEEFADALIVALKEGEASHGR